MSKEYVLSNQTITEAIKQIPRDKWKVFCSELFDYMNSHADTCDVMSALAEAGMIQFEEPKTLKWIDDGKSTTTIVVRDKNSTVEADVVFGGENDN